MAIEMGEYLVGACLEHIFECDVVLVTQSAGGEADRTTQQITELVAVINADYSTKVNKLRAQAKKFRQDAGNPAFRRLQILESLR